MIESARIYDPLAGSKLFVCWTFAAPFADLGGDNLSVKCLLSSEVPLGFIL